MMRHKILGFVKRIFVSAMMFFFSFCNLLSANPLECISMNNQECKVRPEILNVNSKGLLFFSNNDFFHLPITTIVKMLIMTHPLRSWARVKLGLDKKTLCIMFLLWAIWRCGNLLYLKVCWIYCLKKLNVKDVDCNLYPYSV